MLIHQLLPIIVLSGKVPAAEHRKDIRLEKHREFLVKNVPIGPSNRFVLEVAVIAVVTSPIVSLQPITNRIATATKHHLQRWEHRSGMGIERRAVSLWP